MIQFLAIQTTYSHLQIALFNGATLIALTELDKLQASRFSVLYLKKLLEENQTSLKNISFIAVNQGPGPFTTLRVGISVCNGLSFATRIPLITVNGLEAFRYEYEHISPSNLAILLNAFGDDVYYLLKVEKNIQQGCSSFTILSQEINKNLGPILFLGNGAEKYRSTIDATFGNRALFLDPNPQVASIKQIGLLGLQYWYQKKHISYQIAPLYLKSPL